MCPPLPTWEGLRSDTSEHYYGINVKYGCEEGFVLASLQDYIYESEAMVRQSTCNVTGAWEPPFESCIGKYIVQKVIFVYSFAQVNNNIKHFV